MTTTLSASRTFRKLTERATAFVGLEAGDVAAAATVLARTPVAADRVYLVGPRPGPGGIDGVRGWAAGLPDGWAASSRGHYLEGEHPVLRVTRPDGRELEVLRAAVYFGEGDYNASQATGAWDLLRAELRRAFDDGAVLLSSPAATGRELYLRSIPRGVEVETLSDDLQHLIRATTGQGRIEVLEHEAAELPELVGYDGRMMYGALCGELPSGPAEHRRVTEYLGYTRARYSGVAQVPRDWRERCACGAPGHPDLGLLPYMESDRRAGWSYPSEPGRRFGGWWDGAEVRVALLHGWRVDFATAIVWPHRQGDPLGGWARRLVAARARLAMMIRDSSSAVVHRPTELAGAGIRAILLHSVGAFHGAGHRVTRSVPLGAADDVPADARDLRVEGDSIVWADYTGAGWPALSHPEWSAAIWARARARLLHSPTGDRHHPAGALAVDALEVVAFRTDAIYLARDPGWADDGAPGRLRRVLRRPGPLPAPSSHAGLLELVRGPS